jgi:trans-aconitate 2-methyltransferase
MPYLFGEDATAARRLELLAHVFRPSTVDFLDAWCAAGGLDPEIDEPRLLDLGCGPGFTTRLLANRLGRTVIGLDRSSLFLWEARRLGPAAVRFLSHDVTLTPFPLAGADLLFSRFLLSHLPDVGALLATWAGQLRPAGQILIEEVELISTTEETFRTYLDLLHRGMKAAGSELYIGSLLPELAAEAGLEAELDRAHRFPVSDRDAARMFALNLPTVRRRDEIASLADPALLDDLQRELDLLAHSLGSDSRIEWQLRQIALRIQ